MLAPREIALTTEWRPLAELTGLTAEWRALAQRAAEPNVFYDPDFALAAAPVLGPDVGAVLVRAVEPRRLIGFFPCRIETWRYGIRLPLLVGWTHPYAPLGTPLVDREALGAALSAFLEHVAEDEALPKHVLLPYLVEDGPIVGTLAEAIAQRGARVAAVGRHRRALLAPAGDRDGYLDASLGRKRRKELSRQRRRLDETGRLTFALDREPAAVARAMADFLALEARGWKGSAGTAAAQTQAIQKFVESAVNGLAAQGQARIARLLQDGWPIATGVLLTSGSGAWFWKIAHDERAARASPGVQLTLDLTEAMLREPAIAWCDSCAAPGHTMIDSIWRERRAMVDQMIALTPGLDFMLACRLEGTRQSTLAIGRRVRNLLFGR
jgi:CelD/BcsL family acetyltransferase involved in cellulose biosynthesis